MTETTTNLLLIRHGVTDYVATRRVPGWLPGIHLNDEGRAQAAALARRLADLRPQWSAVYSSPLERALETAAPLADAHGLTIQVRQGLGDLHPGDWTGRTVKELEEEPLWSLIQARPSSARLPGGESFLGCQARIVAELDVIRAAHPGQTVVVVFHADPIKMAVAYYLGLPLDLFRRLSISPASVTALAFRPSGPQLVCLNHTASPLVILSEAKDLSPQAQGRQEQGRQQQAAQAAQVAHTALPTVTGQAETQAAKDVQHREQ